MATARPDGKQENDAPPAAAARDLQDCLDEGLDLFGGVYEQLPVINFGRYSDQRPEDSTYIGQLEEQEEDAG